MTEQMEPLDAEELAAEPAEHPRSDFGGFDHCATCHTAWPCVPMRLLATISELEDLLDERIAEGARRLRDQLAAEARVAELEREKGELVEALDDPSSEALMEWRWGGSRWGGRIRRRATTALSPRNSATRSTPKQATAACSLPATENRRTQDEGLPTDELRGRATRHCRGPLERGAPLRRGIAAPARVRT